ncbi:hypothetical protein BDV09DRAFT_30801 [Aspergillus tetrazonus]
MSSPLTRGYPWLMDFHLPYPAYVQIFQELIRRPSCEHAEWAWEVISDNFVVRSTSLRTAPKPVFGSFIKLVLQSWAAREADAIGRGKPLTLPNIVFIVKSWLAEDVANSDVRYLSYGFHDDRDVSYEAVPPFFTQQDISVLGKRCKGCFSI